MTVALIGKFPMAGASALTNVPLAVPTAKPDGSFPAAIRYDSYSSLVAKSGRVESVSTPPRFVAAPRTTEATSCDLAEETMARVEKAKMEHDGEDNASAAEASAEAATFRPMNMARKESCKLWIDQTMD